MGDDWMDMNGDGEVDEMERYLADDVTCSSREEHMAIFGEAVDYPDDEEDEDELEDELEMAGLDRDELELMDEDERREALEDAGLDPDDFDF